MLLDKVVCLKIICIIENLFFSDVLKKGGKQKQKVLVESYFTKT